MLCEESNTEAYCADITDQTTNNVIGSAYRGGFDYNWTVHWGDGTVEDFSGTSSISSPNEFTHVYPTNVNDPNYAEAYTITISAPATDGWLDAFGTDPILNNNVPTNISVISDFIEPFPSKSFSLRHMALAGLFQGMVFDTAIRGDLFDHFYADMASAASLSDEIALGMFWQTFKDVKPLTQGTPLNIPATLFANLDFSDVESAVATFMGTFESYSDDSLGIGLIIPADLFSSLQTTSSVEAFSAMFQNTFANTAPSIPATLFASLDTSSGKNFSGMFQSAFMFATSLGDNVSSVTIPAGLFASLYTSNGTDFSAMFRLAFAGVGGKTNSSIPANLFASLDTSDGENFALMFGQTFIMPNLRNYSIPAGLFASLDTSNGEVLDYMFMETFFLYGTNLNSGANPNPTATLTSVSSIFGAADLSGITKNGTDNATLHRVFKNMFSCYCTNLNGSAQDFINTYLGGLNPLSNTGTFLYQTSITDYSSINPYWTTEP
jgi:hypothetical protein